MEKEHILVVDDEEGLLHLVKMRLKAMGFAVTGCTTGREAIAYSPAGCEQVSGYFTTMCAERGKLQVESRAYLLCF